MEGGVIRFPYRHVACPLLYINDIYTTSSKFKFHLFADDTNLLYANKNLKSLETIVSTELVKVSDWLHANKLTLNTKKSNYVIFHPYQKKINYEAQLKLFDPNTNSVAYLEQQDYVKYLGILIDKNLSWKYHIDYVASKISRTIGIIARLRHFIPLSTLLTIYRSLVAPYLTYGVIAWGQAAKSNLLKILILQKRALRLMHFFPNRDHILPLFIPSNILPINLLYFETVLIFMQYVAHDSVPLNLKNLFRSANQVHSYNTRFSSAGNYYVNSSRTNVMRNSISRLGPNLWNSLNNTTRELPRKRFKTKVHNMLLSFLASEDIYIESPSVIQKLISKSLHNDG